MLVRVFDQQRNTYFKSEVYATVNLGIYEKCLVVLSTEAGRYFKLFDWLDRSDPQMRTMLIHIVLPGESDTKTEQIYLQSDEPGKTLPEYAALLDEEIRFTAYRGCAWIYQDKALLVELLRGGTVSVAPYASQIHDAHAYQLEGWHYVDTQQDIGFIMEQTDGFHDSTLKELHYVSGSYVDDENAMHCVDSVRQVRMLFDSQWCDTIELVFEGVTALHLRPSQDGFASNIFGASIFVRNASVFFCDEEVSDAGAPCEGTWITAYGLRWRFCGVNAAHA